MKNILKNVFCVFITMIIFAACSPDDDYSLGEMYTVGVGDLKLEATPTADKFTYNINASIDVDPVKHLYAYEIKYGDGKGTKNLASTYEYIVLAGTYTVELLVYTPNGEVTKISKDIVFNEDNPKVYQDDLTSVQYTLTGGKDNVVGKEWTLVQGATGLGPVGGTWGEWWQIGDPALFNDVFTFFPNSIQPNGKFVYDNMGDTFMNESLGTLFPDGDPDGSFTTVNYTPATNASWKVESRDGKEWLVLDKGFIGYPVTPDDLNKTEYEILAYNQSEVTLKYYSPDGNAWFFFLSSEEPEEVINLTGGKDAVNGKSWKWRSPENGSGVVMTRTWTDEVWWTIDGGAAGSEAAYDDILTFFADGRVIMQNNGNNFMNETCGDMFSDGNTDASFVTTEYTPSTNATWKFETKDDLQYLVLKNVFPMYGLDPETIVEGAYEIRTLSEDLLQISFVAGTGEWDVTWNFYLVPAN